MFGKAINMPSPANIYLFKSNNRNTRKNCQICSKLTIKTPERRHWRRSVFLLLTSKTFQTFFFDFKQINVKLLTNTSAVKIHAESKQWKN